MSLSRTAELGPGSPHVPAPPPCCLAKEKPGKLLSNEPIAAAKLTSAHICTQHSFARLCCVLLSPVTCERLKTGHIIGLQTQAAGVFAVNEKGTAVTPNAAEVPATAIRSSATSVTCCYADTGKHHSHMAMTVCALVGLMTNGADMQQAVSQTLRLSDIHAAAQSKTSSFWDFWTFTQTFRPCTPEQ